MGDRQQQADRRHTERDERGNAVSEQRGQALSGAYLVTGCAGFIGARVTELLLSDGCRVLGIDNLTDAYDVRLKRWRLDRLMGVDGFTFSEMDISDRKVLDSVDGSGIDGVVNIAARAGVRPSVEDPWVYIDTNVTGALNMLELCRRRGIKKFVQASSSSVYGDRNPQPFQ